MKFYSDYPARRARQIATDVLCLVAIAAWTWLGFAIYGLVMGLRSFGVQMEESGARFRATMTEVSENLAGVPLIGSGITAPFEGASDAGAALESAGVAQQQAVHDLALGLGIGIAVLPILTILVLWLVPRIRFARRAGSARRLASEPASVDLLALRALTGQKLARIRSVHPDAATAWRRGDDTVIRALAALELQHAGVRLNRADASGPVE
jgi:hypothetical protein